MLRNLGLVALMVWGDRRSELGHGRGFTLYVADYAAGRFWIELMRADPATMALGLRINVITSAMVFRGSNLCCRLVTASSRRVVSAAMSGRRRRWPHLESLSDVVMAELAAQPVLLLAHGPLGRRGGRRTSRLAK
jgi:hypothetical protein